MASTMDKKLIVKLLVQSSRRGSFTPTTTPSTLGANHRVTDLRLVLVNFVVAGLEIASSVAFTFIPPLLLKSGYSETQMTIIFGVAPLIALFTVPVIGHWSDICDSKWGRRRPFIFGLSLFLILSLVLLCLGQTMVATPQHQYSGMYVVAFAVILLDYASQAAINPCESLMADMLQSAANANTGFMIYSAMLSLGSCVGYLLSAVDWQIFNNSSSTYCSSEQMAILIVLVLFTITLLVTMIFARERPLRRAPVLSSSLNGGGDPLTLESGSAIKEATSEQQPLAALKAAALVIRAPPITYVTIKKAIVNSFRISFLLACIIKAVTNCCLAILKPIRTVYEAPLVLQRLFWADLLCWMAIMAHSMFCTDYVATVVYGGSAYAERGSIDDIKFDEGVRMGSLGLLLHSTTACIFSSFVQDSVANLIGLKNTYIFGLTTFGASMLFTVMFPSVMVLNICAAFSGVGFAVATTIPCTLITKYHEQPDLYFRDTREANQVVGVGGDMAVLDSTYYLSQIILSVFMGKLVEATGLPHFYIATASLCGFLSALMGSRVAFTASDCNKALKS